MDRVHCYALLCHVLPTYLKQRWERVIVLAVTRKFQSKHRSESEIYNKNRCFHADSIWEDNSRNCRLCHTSKPWRGHSNISIMEECNDLDKRPFWAGHIQASARKVVSHPKNKNISLNSINSLPQIRLRRTESPPREFKNVQTLFSAEQITECELSFVSNDE